MEFPARVIPHLTEVKVADGNGCDDSCTCLVLDWQACRVYGVQRSDL